MPFLLVDAYNGNDDEIFETFDELTKEMLARFDDDDLRNELGHSVRAYEIVRELPLDVETKVTISIRDDEPRLNEMVPGDTYVPYNCQEGR